MRPKVLANKKRKCTTEILFITKTNAKKRNEGNENKVNESRTGVYIKSTTENNAQILFERSMQLKTGGQSSTRVATVH